MHAVEANNIPTEQLDALESFASDLPSAELRDLLLGVSSIVKSGAGATVLASDAELTPAQAARHLRMSRTHLYKLLDRGQLPSHRVGRDRRIQLRDLVQFEADRQRDRRELAERFAGVDRTREAAIDELTEDL